MSDKEKLKSYMSSLQHAKYLKMIIKHCMSKILPSLQKFKLSLPTDFSKISKANSYIDQIWSLPEPLRRACIMEVKDYSDFDEITKTFVYREQIKTGKCFKVFIEELMA